MERREVDAQCTIAWDDGVVAVWVWLDGSWRCHTYPLDLDLLLSLGRTGFEKRMVERFLADWEGQSGDLAA